MSICETTNPSFPSGLTCLILFPGSRWCALKRSNRMVNGTLGPYSSARDARITLNFIRRLFPLRQCTERQLATCTRPCLNCQMRRCLCPCAGKVDPEEYTAAWWKGSHCYCKEGPKTCSRPSSVKWTLRPPSFASRRPRGSEICLRHWTGPWKPRMSRFFT